MDVQEVRKLDAYLKKLFGNARIRVVPRPKKEDSAEVYIGEEFVGVLFVDDEDDERAIQFPDGHSRHRSGMTVLCAGLRIPASIRPCSTRLAFMARSCNNRTAGEAFGARR